MSEDDERADDPPLVRSEDEGSQREVVVPLRLYKTVTVFSTLFAIFSVVGGFILVDVATDRASAPAAEIDVPVAIGGVGLILAGTVVYAFSTRFRTEEMGKSKDDADEPSGNG
jgi:preprotein translocase subunit SecY